MIKKLVITAVAALCCIFASNAQSTEISVSYGGYTQMDATNMHDGWGGVSTAWGALNLGVNFRITPRIWIGPSYTFSSTSTKGPDASHIAYHVIMFNGRYEYYRNSIVRVYAHLGVGCDLSYMQPSWRDNYTKGYFAFQASPIGAQVDLSRNWSIFGEAGFGAQGIIQVGARLRL